MTGVSSDVVRARSADIRGAVAEARRLAALPDDEFFADPRNVYSVEHLLLVAMEAAAALCTHIMARSARQAPSSYAECLGGMTTAGIVDESLGARLTRMARFRNLLVHRYWDIDERLVLDYVRHDLGDLEDYLAAVGRWMQRQQPS
jgi:uncharacterized protein YutE (UPF0331/DUF86 family)